MDLGIRGKTALVCAASKGLGRGCAFSLAREGVELIITARGRDALEKTAEEIRRACGVRVTPVAGDITTEEGRRAALAALPGARHPGEQRRRSAARRLREWDRAAWMKALDANMLTPIELIKATVDGMIARKFGRIVNITSSAVKAPLGPLGLVERRALGPHRLHRRARAPDGESTTSPSISLARVLMTDRNRTTVAAFAKETRTERGNRRSPSGCA